MINLLWTFPDGSRKRERGILESRAIGTVSLRIPAARLRESGAVSLRVTPAFGHAVKGEAGYWFSPYGYYGEWDRDEGLFRPGRDRMNMPMFGWATPRGAWLAIITSLRLYPRMVVEAHGGRYAVSCELGEELCRNPYEDFEIVFHPFPAGTDYAALARRYRELRLARGEVRPLRERADGNPALAYAAAAPEIRIRQAWKPVPSPVPHQQPENEPPVQVAVPFSRVRDISRALRKAGADCQVSFILASGGKGCSERARPSMERWAAALPPHCAVFAVNDCCARCAARALSATGRSLPRSATLVGVDGGVQPTCDTSLAETISSIRIDFELAGYIAARMIASDAPPDTVETFPPLLVDRRKSTRGRGRREPRILEAMEVIRRDACDGLTVAKLASRFKGSRRLFEMRFREAAGHTALDEIINVRLARAVELLANTDMPIAAVADASGFKTELDFWKVFRKRMGVPPLRFRSARK